MTLVGKKILADFALKHADARAAIRAWTAEVENAAWQDSAEVKARYPSASLIGAGRVVFNIKGNHYRLDVSIDYTTQVVLVRSIGTHAEYDSWTF
jgi:mRNA interferase HigB